MIIFMQNVHTISENDFTIPFSTHDISAPRLCISCLNYFNYKIGSFAANYLNYTQGTKLQFTRLSNNLTTILQKSALKENKPCSYF